jgi:hypothetical protein
MSLNDNEMGGCYLDYEIENYASLHGITSDFLKFIPKDVMDSMADNTCGVCKSVCYRKNDRNAKRESDT